VRKARAGNARERILDAAERLALREGVATLTLDRVAAEAAVSKGGLLYHFTSKEALIEGMVERQLRAFEQSLEVALAAEPVGPGRRTRALLRASFGSATRPAKRERQATVALLAAVVNRPSLLDPVRAAYTRWMEELNNDGLPDGQAVVALAALDGLYFWSLLGLARLPAARARAVRGVLESLTRGPSRGGR
jgi:AcrR family transcriptional regulator